MAVKSFDARADRRVPRGGKMLEADIADFNRQSYLLHKYLVLVATIATVFAAKSVGC
ncbi:hypothetical protein [Ferruginivarius sediminum]|uniref:hypothetical protein n=1 Tax=Ferruginivarius sediminum TaxID=2661937 RepID=UPI0012940C88|nr:hypothetical protein [Ferruginivarius sediminum]